MRVYKKKKQIVEKEIMTLCKCDICGLEAKSCNWDASIYESKETEISVTCSLNEGTTYPDGGWGEMFQIDICPKCFKEKLIPWIESHGSKVKPKQWEY